MTLTPNEKLLIWRRRAGLTQLAAAAKLGVAPRSIHRMEVGTKPVRVTDEILSVNRLKDHERCLIERRRRGIKQKTLAQNLGCCASWLQQMEHGLVDCTQLKQHLGV